MPNFSVTDKELVDSVNYLLAGPTGIGQNSVGYWNGDGGYISPTNTPPYISSSYPTTDFPDRTTIWTPAQVLVNTTSSQDRVIVSAQSRPFLEWSATDPNTDFNFYISVTRYAVKIVGTNTEPTYIDPIELAQDNNVFTGNAGNPGTISIGDTIFVSIIDQPNIGRWFYVLDLYLRINNGDPVIQSFYVENLSLSTTVIKL
jgi:hypothetical protein